MQGASLRAREKMAAARRCESPYHLLTSMLGWMSRKYAFASKARACRGSAGLQGSWLASRPSCRQTVVLLECSGAIAACVCMGGRQTMLMRLLSS